MPWFVAVFYVIVVLVASGCLMGAVAALIAEARGRDRDTGFLWGFFLGFIGIAVVSLGRSGVRMPDAPTGLVAMRCYTCNAVQNVDPNDSSFMCWQCDSPTIMRATDSAADPDQLSTVCPACSKRLRINPGVVCFYCPHCSDRINTLV